MPVDGSGGNAGGADGAGSSGHHAGRADSATRRRSVQTSLVVVPVWNWCGRLHHLLNAPARVCGLRRNKRVSLGDGAPDLSPRVWLHHRPSVMGDGHGASRGILGSLVEVVAAWNWSGRLHHLLHGLHGVVREWSKLPKRVLIDWGGRWWELHVLVLLED